MCNLACILYLSAEENKEKSLTEYQQTAITATQALDEFFEELSQSTDDSEKEYQRILCDVGKKYFGEKNLRDWYNVFYAIGWRQQHGPKLQQFILIYGKEKFISWMEGNINSFPDRI